MFNIRKNNINNIKITETVLRDGHQSLMATRMKINDIEPIISIMDEVGYDSVECWGGATYDVCMRYLNEDPWERLRILKKGFKKTKLQMLLRGQNLLGYRHYSDDVVEAFIGNAIINGIDNIRIFDALNDIRNITKAAEIAKREGAHVQLAMSYTTGTAYDNKYWIELAKTMEQMGADSLCIKDMAGLLLPYTAEDLIKNLKKHIKIPINLHSHCTSGVAPYTYLKAIEAGCDWIDTAISPFSMGTSQPSTEIIYEIIKTKYNCSKLNDEKLKLVSAYFKKIRKEAENNGMIKSDVMNIDIDTHQYQIPGGMLSNLKKQIEEQKIAVSFPELLKEIPIVREELGEPPLVTPTSQIIGTQAIFNIIGGERYKIISNQTKALVKGEYGKTAKVISDEIKRKIIGNAEEIKCRPADLLQPELSNSKNMFFEKGNYILEKELSYILFPQIAEKFYKKIND